MESKAKRQKVKKNINAGLTKVKAKSTKAVADGAFSIPVYNAKGSSGNQSAKRFIGLLVDGLVGCIGIRNLILN